MATASSPLEIYEKAYQLQYESNDIPGACEIYKQIIKEFPDSNESGYAAIQLQKIHAMDVARKLDRTGGPLPVITLALAVIALLVGVGTMFKGYLYMREQQAEMRKTSALFQALGLASVGRDSDALKLLSEAKMSASHDIAPYALAADLHIRKNDFAAARDEFETYTRLYGEPVPAIAQTPATTVTPAVTSPNGAVAESTPPPPDNGAKKKGAPAKVLNDKNAVLKYLDSISNTP